MSILDNNPTNSQAISSAQEIVNQTRQTFDQMAQSFNDGAVLFWANPYGVKPSEIVQYLGNSAGEIFRLHYALGQLLLSIKPESISLGLSLIGNFTINQDGTVTILNEDNLPPTTPINFNTSFVREE